MKLALEEELANRVLNYLAQRPYVEVAGMIDEMMRSERLEDQKEGDPWVDPLETMASMPNE